MSLFGALALLRRHFVAVLVILVIAVGIEYSFKHSAPTYAEVGTMVFIPPISGAHPNAYAAVGGSILEAAGTLAVSAMSPQEQQQVLRGGGNAAYDVELLNSYNLEYPNYSNAYLTVSTASDGPCRGAPYLRIGHPPGHQPVSGPAGRPMALRQITVLK